MEKENLSEEEIQKIIDEITERLNSEEYINEIMSVLEKLEKGNPEYKLFNEEAKSYHRIFLLRTTSRGYITEIRKKTKVYFPVKDTFKNLKEIKNKLPDGIYLLIFKDMKTGSGYDERAYYVKDEGSSWSVFKLENTYDKEIVLFGLYYMVKYKDAIYDVITELPNKQFYLYLHCGEGCMWMPQVVFNAIWPIVRKHIRKIMREVLKIDIGETIEEETLNQDENINISQQVEQFVEKGINDTICWWIKYIIWAYSVPNILIEKLISRFHTTFTARSIREGLRYGISLDRRAIIFFPKPTVLPKQIVIQKPEDIKQIPEGVYPIIGYQREQFSFALTPNTEVIFVVDTRMKRAFSTIDEEPISPFGLDFVFVKNNNITRYSILNFREDLREMAKMQFNNPSISGLRPTYWWLGRKYYLPEVLFLRLVNQENKVQQEEYTINFMEKFYSKGWFDWVKTVKDEHSNLPIDENVKVIEWDELRKMRGIWYIKGDFKEDNVLIVEVGNKQMVLQVKIPTSIKKLILSEEKPTFIVVWSDETIGIVIQW
jgi:hypothetical protein